MEVRTSELVAKELKALGYEVKTGIGKTGVAAIMKNGDGPVVMYRADMDAIAAEEKTGVPYASIKRVTNHDGVEVAVAHLCRHDRTGFIGELRYGPSHCEKLEVSPARAGLLTTPLPSIQGAQHHEKGRIYNLRGKEWTIVMLKKITWIGMLLCVLAVFEVQPLKAEEAAKSGEKTTVKTSPKNDKISLAEVAPELYYQLRRYPKFYGDPNTIHGNLLERSYLLGSLGGGRDVLVDHGFYFDAAVTQFLQGVVSGGKDDGSARYNGTADYWLTFDSGKAGLWSGGAVFLHAESSWQADRSINSDAGSLLPPNFDATMPTPNVSDAIALPEFFLAQALPANFLMLAGKVNFAGAGDTNLFANNERTQFSYTGLVNNPILGAFIPYTPLGGALVWAPNKQHNLTLLASQAKGNATTSGFDNFNGEYTVGGQYQFSPTLGGSLPGHYLALVGYSKKDLVNFDIDPRQLIGEIIGVVPVAQKSNNYALLLNFDQYLWVKGGSPAPGRKNLPPVGIGIFGRAGWAPKDRNVIDQFYSFGIGGYGMVIPGRDNDQWGIGWAGTHISSDLRDNLGFLRVDLNSFENAFEAFYNFQVTPAAHLTLDAQIIDSTVASVDTAYTLGMRLQVDF